MWIRECVYRVAPQGIVYLGRWEPPGAGKGPPVLMCELRGTEEEIEVWMALKSSPQPGVLGLLDVQNLPSGRCLLVSELVPQWRPMSQAPVDLGVETQILVHGKVLTLAISWFQHPGKTTEEQQALTLPTPRLRLPFKAELEVVLVPVIIMAIAAGWALVK